MPLFLLTAGSGWIAALLLGANVSAAYFIRSTQGGPAAYFSRFRVHYALGLLIPAVTIFHAWLPMSAGRMRGFGSTGLLLATAALFIMFWQVALGISLRDAQGAVRSHLRRLHFATMALIVSLVAMHILLNGGA